MANWDRTGSSPTRRAVVGEVQDAPCISATVLPWYSVWGSAETRLRSSLRPGASLANRAAGGPVSGGRLWRCERCAAAYGRVNALAASIVRGKPENFPRATLKFIFERIGARTKYFNRCFPIFFHIYGWKSKTNLCDVIIINFLSGNAANSF